jgi:hypothetical protein
MSITKRQEKNLRVVRERLQHGPGMGWEEVMRSDRPGPLLWLETWVFPTIDELLTEHAEQAARLARKKRAK